MIPEEYYRAGRMAAKVREEAKALIRPGLRVLELCEWVENRIREMGGEPAFPCNVSINEVAAHYTAQERDPLTVKEGDLVKLDLGVHLNGYLVDTAVTVALDPTYYPLVEATKRALEEAIRVSRMDMRMGEIGRVIADVAARRGFKTIINLSGHSIEHYKVHAGKSIPNTWVSGTPELKEGEVYAIEPFLTTKQGAGRVIEGSIKEIYSIVARKRTGDAELDELLERLWERYRTLPFAARQLSNLLPSQEVKSLLEELVKRKVLRCYPVLIEGRNAPVAQFEHTITLDKGSPIVLTA